LGIAIDGGVRMKKIQEACTVGSNQACVRTSYMQVTGFVGSAGGGVVRGIAGAKVATAFVGGIALAFGVTFGAPALAIIAVAGAAAGAYYSGSGGGGFGEYVGDIIYQRVKR